MQEFISRVYLVTIKSRTAVETKDSETAPGTMPGKLVSHRWQNVKKSSPHTELSQRVPRGAVQMLRTENNMQNVCSLLWVTVIFFFPNTINEQSHQPKGEEKILRELCVWHSMNIL